MNLLQAQPSRSPSLSAAPQVRKHAAFVYEGTAGWGIFSQTPHGNDGFAIRDAFLHAAGAAGACFVLVVRGLQPRNVKHTFFTEVGF